MTEQWPSNVRRALGPPPVVEPTARWVRVEFAGQTVADSKRALLLMEYGPGRLPTYYFPQEDVRLDALEPLPAEGASGERAYFRAPGDDAPGRCAAWIYQNPPPGLDALRGYVSFTWDAPATWYEEAERVVAHARDPHHRVDAITSSRHVEVIIAGETVADTHAPVLLFETTLAHPLLHPAARRAHGPAGAQRPQDDLPLQRRRDLPSRQYRGALGEERRLELPGPHPGMPQEFAACSPSTMSASICGWMASRRRARAPRGPSERVAGEWNGVGCPQA